MLSGFVDEDQLLDALRAGASGYIIKKSDISELVLAIQTVQRGNSYFSSALSEGFDLAEVLYNSKRPDQRSGADSLTPREREVLQLIAEGHTNQGIANELYISVKTVEAHKSHIMSKLHARNRTDLIGTPSARTSFASKASRRAKTWLMTRNLPAKPAHSQVRLKARPLAPGFSVCARAR